MQIYFIVIADAHTAACANLFGFSVWCIRFKSHNTNLMNIIEKNNPPMFWTAGAVFSLNWVKRRYPWEGTIQMIDFYASNFQLVLS